MCNQRQKLGTLYYRWRILEFGAKYAIPKPASDPESVLVICEMMFEVVFLEFLVVGR